MDEADRELLRQYPKDGDFTIETWTGKDSYRERVVVRKDGVVTECVNGEVTRSVKNEGEPNEETDLA